MNEDYTIEQLEKTFREHSEKFDREEIERFNIAMKEGRGYPIERPFRLSEALHVICREINQLKSITNGRRYEILNKLPID